MTDESKSIKSWKTFEQGKLLILRFSCALFRKFELMAGASMLTLFNQIGNRMLAIVSVEGGPSRESLDVVFTLMKESLHPEEAGDNALENEEVSSAVVYLVMSVDWRERLIRYKNGLAVHALVLRS